MSAGREGGEGWGKGVGGRVAPSPCYHCVLIGSWRKNRTNDEIE